MRKPTTLMRVGLSFADQAAFGASTFAVTAVVSRTSSDATFGRFMVVWTLAWTISALLSELIVTPIRLTLPAGEIELRTVEGLATSLLVVAAAFVLADAALLLSGIPTPILDVAIVPLAGVAFILRRAICYSLSAVTTALRFSAMNVAATAALLGLVAVTDGSVARWGKFVAAAALLVPLIFRKPTRPDLPRVLRTTRRVAARGAWFAASTGLRGLVYSSGLLAAVKWRGGSASAAEVGHVFVLVSPVQLASSALPLLLLPELVRSWSAGHTSFRAAMRRQFLLYAGMSIAGVTILVAVFPWWRGALIREDAAVGVTSLPVALTVAATLLASWAGSALQVVRPARMMFVPTLATLAVLGALVGVGISPSYLVPASYGVAVVVQLALVATAKGARQTSSRLTRPIIATGSGGR